MNTFIVSRDRKNVSVEAKNVFPSYDKRIRRSVHALTDAVV
jgi:hypothetical protein